MKKIKIMTAAVLGSIMMNCLCPLAAEQETEGKAIADDSVAGWHIVVEDVRRDKLMENVSVELGYTSVETSNFVKEAEEGKEFFLVKLLIEKEGSREVISWENLLLKDEEDQTYIRMEDEFIEDLGMMRMAGNDLNFGSNEGWIAFEIDESAKDLVLTYEFEEEEYSCALLTDEGETETVTEKDTEAATE